MSKTLHEIRRAFAMLLFLAALALLAGRDALTLLGGVFEAMMHEILFVFLIAIALASMIACTSSTAPCVRGAPILSAQGDTLGYVCTNYRR